MIIHSKIFKINPTCLQGNDSLGEFRNISHGVLGAEKVTKLERRKK